MDEFKFQLGQPVKDKVTGFRGVIMGRTQYITQCNTYGICPRELTKEGKRPDWGWIDEDQLEPTGGSFLSLVPEKKPKTGGPHCANEEAPGR